MRNPPLQKDRCSVSLSVPRLQLAWRGWKREPPRAPTAPLISPQPPTSTAAGLSYRRRLIGAPRWTALGRRRRGGRLGWPPRASRGWRLGGRAAWAGGPSPALPVFLPAIRGSVPWNSSWEGEALFCVASSGPRPPLLFHPPRPPPRPARSSLGLPSVRGGSTRSGRLDPAVAAPTAQYHQPATAATVQDSTQSPLTRGHVGSAPHRRQSVKTPRPRPPTAAAAIVVAAVGDAADKKASPCGMEPVKTKVEHQTPPPPPPLRAQTVARSGPRRWSCQTSTRPRSSRFLCLPDPFFPSSRLLFAGDHTTYRRARLVAASLLSPCSKVCSSGQCLICASCHCSSYHASAICQQSRSFSLPEIDAAWTQLCSVPHRPSGSWLACKLQDRGLSRADTVQWYGQAEFQLTRARPLREHQSRQECMYKQSTV